MTPMHGCENTAAGSTPPSAETPAQSILAQVLVPPYLAGMRIVSRLNPVGGMKDFWSEFTRPNPYRWPILIASVLMTLGLLYGIIKQGGRTDIDIFFDAHIYQALRVFGHTFF